MKKIFFSLTAIALFFASCKPELEVAELSSGDADFTKYVAIGNSLTAGYSDGALYEVGQNNSYPNMLAKQFKLVGGAAMFNLPITSLNGSDGGAVGGVGRRKLAMNNTYDCAGVQTGTAVGVSVYANDDISTNIYTSGGFQNMGIPGIKMAYVNLPSVAFPNIFFNRIASSNTATYMQDVMAQQPTFFTFWLGNNDVLLYATSGGQGATSGFGPTDMTDANAFEANVEGFLDTLQSIGAQGVIANIPSVTSVPFFTTIPAYGLALTTQAQADGVNFLIGATGVYNPSNYVYKIGANPFVIADNTVPGGKRLIKPNEYILLTTSQDSLKCSNWGLTVPLADRYVLDLAEVKSIDSVTALYNTILKDAAMARNFAFVDMNNYLASFGSGITYDGVAMNSKFVQGGIFSLDGVHPTAQGYALAANEFIKTISAKYKTIMPMIEVNDYPGVVFP